MGKKKAPKIYGEKKRWLQLYQIRTVWSPFFFGLAVRYRYEIHFHCDLTRGQNESWNLTEETIDIEDAAETASSLHRMEGSLPGSTSDPSVKKITNHNGHNDPQHHSPHAYSGSLEIGSNHSNLWKLACHHEFVAWESTFIFCIEICLRLLFPSLCQEGDLNLERLLLLCFLKIWKAQQQYRTILDQHGIWMFVCLSISFLRNQILLHVIFSHGNTVRTTPRPDPVCTWSWTQLLQLCLQRFDRCCLMTCNTNAAFFVNDRMVEKGLSQQIVHFHNSWSWLPKFLDVFGLCPKGIL